MSGAEKRKAEQEADKTSEEDLIFLNFYTSKIYISISLSFSLSLYIYIYNTQKESKKINE